MGALTRGASLRDGPDSSVGCLVLGLTSVAGEGGK